MCDEKGQHCGQKRVVVSGDVLAVVVCCSRRRSSSTIVSSLSLSFSLDVCFTTLKVVDLGRRRL